MLQTIGPYLLYVVLILIMMFLSFFFSGTETALLSSSRLHLDSKARAGSRSARRALGLLDNAEDALGMTLVGNNIVNISSSAFITFIATRAFFAGEIELMEVTAVETMVFLMLCEVAPKVYARAHPERFLMFLSLPIKALMLVLKPLVTFSLLLSRGLKRLFKISGINESIVRNREEIDILFKISEEEGLIGQEHHDYVAEILSFSEITARQIMTPTIDIVAIELHKSIRELAELFVDARFSRIPVYESRVDNIIGYVFYRDVLKKPRVKKIGDVMNRAHYVPATKKVVELYTEMVEELIPMVFVVNEYGAVMGMVTHEDIAEEVVGEIHTTDQSETELITKSGRQKYLLSGKLDIEYFMKRFNVAVEKKGFETLAGFIMHRLGRIPRKGDRIDFDRYTLIIEEATERSIEKILIQPTRKK